MNRLLKKLEQLQIRGLNQTNRSEVSIQELTNFIITEMLKSNFAWIEEVEIKLSQHIVEVHIKHSYPDGISIGPIVKDFLKRQKYGDKLNFNIYIEKRG